MVIPSQLDGRLPKWDEVNRLHEWSGILVGNGASLALWDEYRYESLLTVALSNRLSQPLSLEASAIFQALRTSNFERVMEALRSCELVSTVLQPGSQAKAESCRDDVRRALIASVLAVHVPWENVPWQTLTQIRDALLEFEYVYSTNYDLLLYWCVMADGSGTGFKDYFWSGFFDSGDTRVWDKVTRILFLHGGLHLYRMSGSTTHKRVAATDRNLLELFAQGLRQDESPVFVAEGTSDDKLAAIRSSDYLSFAFGRFAEHEGPLVVFGHALGPADRHLLDAMGRWGPRALAISILPSDETAVRQMKAAYVQSLPEAQLTFFDATSHPMGDPGLRINVSRGWGG